MAAVRPLLELYRDEAAGEFGPLKLKQVREVMVSLGWTRTFVNKQVVRLRRVFKWGVENELVEPSVHHALQAVAGLKRGKTSAPEPKPVPPVSWEDVEAVLPHVAPQIQAMMLLQWHTGMRPGEVVLMRTCDIERDEDVWTFTPESHKTEYHGRERRIELGPKAQAILIQWLRLDPSQFLFQPAKAEEARARAKRQARRTKVQPSQVARGMKARPRKHRERYGSDTYGKAVRRACEQAGITPWAPNQLRHSRATEIRKQFGLEGAQVVLGHANARITEVYAERDRELARRIAREIG